MRHLFLVMKKNARRYFGKSESREKHRQLFRIEPVMPIKPAFIPMKCAIVFRQINNAKEAIFNNDVAESPGSLRNIKHMMQRH